MNALINAHTRKEDTPSPSTGPTSNVLPKAQCSHTGVSSECAPKTDMHWFVLRVTYNRTQKACDILSMADVQSYMPMHYIIKERDWEEEANTKASSSQSLFCVYHKRTCRLDSQEKR